MYNSRIVIMKLRKSPVYSMEREQAARDKYYNILPEMLDHPVSIFTLDNLCLTTIIYELDIAYPENYELIRNAFIAAGAYEYEFERVWNDVRWFKNPRLLPGYHPSLYGHYALKAIKEYQKREGLCLAA